MSWFDGFSYSSWIFHTACLLCMSARVAYIKANTVSRMLKKSASTKKVEVQVKVEIKRV